MKKKIVYREGGDLKAMKAHQDWDEDSEDMEDIDIPQAKLRDVGSSSGFGARGKRAEQKPQGKHASRPASSKPKKAGEHPMFDNYMAPKYAPRKGHAEKDKMYEDPLKGKQSISALKDENIKLRALSKHHEAEMNKKDRLIRELFDQMQNPDMQPFQDKKPQTHLVVALKKKVNEVRKENRQLKEGLAMFKRSTKLTRVQEIEAEQKIYSEECARLRKMLNHMINNKKGGDDRPRSESKEQVDLANKLKKENSDLKEKLQKSEDEVKKNKINLDSVKLGFEKERLKDQATIKDLRREIQGLKDQINRSSSQEDHSKQLQRQLEEAKNAKTLAEKQKREQEQKTATLEKKLAESKREFEEQIAALKEQLAKKEMENAKKEPAPEKPKKEEPKKEQKRKLVEIEEVAGIARQLRMNLIIMKVPYQEIQNELFKNLREEDDVSVRDLSKLLSTNQKAGPLSEDQATVFARFLIEPQTHQMIAVRDDYTKPFGTILDIILELVEEYILFTSDSQIGAITKSILNKISSKFAEIEKILKSCEVAPNTIQESIFYELNEELALDLAQEEVDYCINRNYTQSLE